MQENREAALRRELAERDRARNAAMQQLGELDQRIFEIRLALMSPEHREAVNLLRRRTADRSRRGRNSSDSSESHEGGGHRAERDRDPEDGPRG